MERTTWAEVLGAISSAARELGSVSIADAFGATVSIRIVPDEGRVAVLEVSWEFTAFDQLDRFPMDILAMIPGNEDVDAWDYLPPRLETDSPHTWYTYVTTEWVEYMATYA